MFKVLTISSSAQMYQPVPGLVCFEGLKRSDSAQNVEAISVTGLLNAGCSRLQIWSGVGANLQAEADCQLPEDLRVGLPFCFMAFDESKPLPPGSIRGRRQTSNNTARSVYSRWRIT